MKDKVIHSYDPAIFPDFSERELNEIDYCTDYVQYFNHGTDGHTMRVIIAKLAKLVESLSKKENE